MKKETKIKSTEEQTKGTEEIEEQAKGDLSRPDPTDVESVVEANEIPKEAKIEHIDGKEVEKIQKDANKGIQVNKDEVHAILSKQELKTPDIKNEVIHNEKPKTEAKVIGRAPHIHYIK